MTKEVQIFKKHTKKVPFVTFNPVVSDVLCSGAFLGEIFVWNAIKAETLCELKADDTPTLVRWNQNGTLIGATNENKNINIFDVRYNKMIFKHQINEAFQAAKFAWVNNEQFVTTSWNKAGAKMLKLWDIGKVKEDLTSEGEVLEEKIDTSKTVSTPFVDKESKLVYTIGKGESTIHIYDFEEGKFKRGIDFTSAEPSISSVMFDRKYLDYNTLEVDRFARYVNSQKIYYVSFTIPRKSSRFDPELYPPFESGEAALSYNQWVNGETTEPIRKEINTIENKFISKNDVFVMQDNFKTKEPDSIPKGNFEEYGKTPGETIEATKKEPNIEIDLLPEKNNIEKIVKDLYKEINIIKEEKNKSLEEIKNLKNELEIMKNKMKNMEEKNNKEIEELKKEIKDLKNSLETKNEYNNKKIVYNSAIMKENEFDIIKSAIESRMNKKVKNLEKLYQANN